MSELASLCEGETLMIGGKEVEVMGMISAEDFARGRCFLDVHVEKEEPSTRSAPPPSRPMASKPFSRPNLLSGAGAQRLGAKPLEQQPCKPRHDPLAPGINKTNSEDYFGFSGKCDSSAVVTKWHILVRHITCYYT